MDSDIQQRLHAIRQELAALRNSASPNEPISDFSILDTSFLAEWEVRLSGVKAETLIEEVSVLLEEVKLPKLDAADIRHDHLKIYHQVSELREVARAILSDAISRGYPHDLSIVAKTNDIAPDLKNIATSLERIETRITIIQQQASPTIGDGIAVAVGPISVTLGALKQAAALARQKIQFDQENLNVSALIVALSRTASLANEVGVQINSFLRDIPRRLQVALSEVVRLANQAADQGVELLRSIRAQRADATPPLVNRELDPGSHNEMIDVAEILRGARLAQEIELEMVARHLKVAIEYVEAIDEGKFAELPGRTYAIGWVRAYARYLGMNPEPILAALRMQLPRDWLRPRPDWVL